MTTYVSSTNMVESFQQFLETSSIAGLSFIAASRRFSRLFWVVVVFTGFVGSVILIHSSFKSWEESPVTTIIETHPISEITFPTVIVCPPRNTFTNLNFDVLQPKR